MLTCMELHGNRAQQSVLLWAQHAGQGRSMRSVKGGRSLQRGCLQSSCRHQPSAQQLKHCLPHRSRQVPSCCTPPRNGLQLPDFI